MQATDADTSCVNKTGQVDLLTTGFYFAARRSLVLRIWPALKRIEATGEAAGRGANGSGPLRMRAQPGVQLTRAGPTSPLRPWMAAACISPKTGRNETCGACLAVEARRLSWWLTPARVSGAWQRMASITQIQMGVKFALTALRPEKSSRLLESPILQHSGQGSQYAPTASPHSGARPPGMTMRS